MLANAIDENLTATSTTTTDEGSPQSTQSSAESEKPSSEQEDFTFSDHSTGSETVDLNSLGINVGDAGGAFVGGGAPLGGAAPLDSGSLLGGAMGGAGGGVGSLGGEVGGSLGGAGLGEFGASSPSDVLCESTECNSESTTECSQTTECSEDRFSSESQLSNFGTMGDGGDMQPALMERGSKSVAVGVNDESASMSDTSETSLHQSSTKAPPSPTTSNAGSISTAQETECVTVTPSSSSESATTPFDTDSTTATSVNKDEHVTKDMTKERLKRLEKDLKLVNEVERILNAKGPKHKVHKRDLESMLADTSDEENQTPVLEIRITVKTEGTEYPETFYDKPSKSVREVNKQMLRGLGKLLKWRNSHNSHHPSRPRCLQPGD
ncbi:unnamed protein product [Callosobruchus maculatus]|uniref:Uncharacterized protein n=1 Tax=Callosobruchus maculatus TaxID=64391 RepID=A0A653BF72_CALMS|nr:unnamed protein product [Callosobruchus maculatus]